MLVSGIQNHQSVNFCKKDYLESSKKSINLNHEQSNDTFSKSTADKLAFKGTGKAAVGSVIGGLAGLAVLAAAPLTFGLAPVVAGLLFCGGTVAGGVMKEKGPDGKEE